MPSKSSPRSRCSAGASRRYRKVAATRTERVARVAVERIGSIRAAVTHQPRHFSSHSALAHRVRRGGRRPEGSPSTVVQQGRADGLERSRRRSLSAPAARGRRAHRSDR
jgi:hypothetical protein